MFECLFYKNKKELKTAASTNHTYAPIKWNGRFQAVSIKEKCVFRMNLQVKQILSYPERHVPGQDIRNRMRLEKSVTEYILPQSVVVFLMWVRSNVGSTSYD